MRLSLGQMVDGSFIGQDWCRSILVCYDYSISLICYDYSVTKWNRRYLIWRNFISYHQTKRITKI